MRHAVVGRHAHAPDPAAAAPLPTLGRRVDRERDQHLDLGVEPPRGGFARVRALVGQGRTVVSVLHEITLALMADDVVVMAQGRVVHAGPCADAASHRALEAVFDHRIAIHPLNGRPVALPR